MGFPDRMNRKGMQQMQFAHASDYSANSVKKPDEKDTLARFRDIDKMAHL